MDVLIDYLTFTLKENTISDVVNLLGLQDVKWLAGRAYNGWKECSYCNGIRILSGGRDDVCADMSGVGCRWLESVNGHGFDWLELLSWLINSACANVSRLDVACDDKAQLLTMQKLVQFTQKGKYISRARKKRWINGDEQSVIWGSPSSDTRLRIYNKALERHVEGHWIRAEFQLRDQAADSFLKNLDAVKNIGRCYGGVMNNYLRYTTVNPESCNGHYDDVSTARWWAVFVGTVERIKNITVGGMEYNFGKLEWYLESQVASSIKAYIDANDGDITPLVEMAVKAKLNKKQKMMIWTYQLERDYAWQKQEGTLKEVF